MASVPASRGGTPGPANRQIPLLCTVCPETPRFSDVSHLLTHIASKGHLHHETLTRLKSHQTVEANQLMDQYETWYKDNGIEELLVERMKAKQMKEAAKVRRARGTTPVQVPKLRPKTKRLSSSTTVKSEHDDFAPNFPLFPGFSLSEYDVDMQDETIPGNDALALKGQVWPGMGKMDLANEDMKRTRNQRKPSSVIERMRRTSEGIEPTQVVMTSDFEVERVKGVYDSSSPIPGQEEATPKKVVKPKRKRSGALAEISSNVPRGINKRLARGGSMKPNRLPRVKLNYDRDTSSEQTSSRGASRHSQDLFLDDDSASMIYENRSYSTPCHQDENFGARDRFGLHAMNPISHPSVVSPTPLSRELSARLQATREHRTRAQTQAYFGSHHSHLGLGSFSQNDYGLNDGSILCSSTRLPFAPNGHFGSLNQDSFHLAPSPHAQPRLGDYSTSGPNTLSNSGGTHFLSMSESNPLLIPDRSFLPSNNQPHVNQALPSFSFTPINGAREFDHSSFSQERHHGEPFIKLEAQGCEEVENNPLSDLKTPGFNLSSLWDPQPSDVCLDGQRSPGEAELGL
ncbi:hypothetical protein HIM_00431 [Hirsutella minnesotensis 3608]|nr:hypothetical protein HIM_00431 [Hirsutella minnesotensis 3608]